MNFLTSNFSYLAIIKNSFNGGPPRAIAENKDVISKPDVRNHRQFLGIENLYTMDIHQIGNPSTQHFLGND